MDRRRRIAPPFLSLLLPQDEGQDHTISPDAGDEWAGHLSPVPPPVIAGEDGHCHENVRQKGADPRWWGFSLGILVDADESRNERDEYHELKRDICDSVVTGRTPEDEDTRCEEEGGDLHPPNRCELATDSRVDESHTESYCGYTGDYPLG